MSESRSLSSIKGLGPQRLKRLGKLGIYSISDLLSYFPSRYEDRSKILKIAELQDGEYATIQAKITRVEEKIPKRGLKIFKAYLADETGVAEAVWFNQPFLKTSMKPGVSIMLTGKVKANHRWREIAVTEYDLLSNLDSQQIGRIVPIYPSTEGLNQKFWRKLQYEVINCYAADGGLVPEVFDAEEREKLQLVSAQKAYEDIHFPADFESINKAHYRLAFEELYLLQIALAVIRNSVIKEKHGITHKKEHPLTHLFTENLPFKMTKAQEKVIAEIACDMENLRPMQRLVQGDVGSGKTLIAARAILKAVGNNYLGVIMAPTEILARQHYETLSKWFEPLGIKTALLTKGISAPEREQIALRVASGNIKVVVGTHALIQNNVTLEKCGLVVIDEQHRFGVRQRSLLEQKGDNPDVLVMTATPIPRTLALTVYGDLDISTLDELPPGRKLVQTYCISEQSRQKLMSLIEKQLQLGTQVYIVCPLVEESEMLDIKNATGLAEKLQKEINMHKVGLLHGRMSSNEKEYIMNEFIMGKIKVLVTTTVIEVGVNNPNATVMIIENAERFGLAQLHQLRGRVGRGNEQSFCILVTISREQNVIKRLKMFTKNNDGFQLAEEDLKIRGPGEFFGMRQHGLPEFKAADLIKDIDILKKAQSYARDILRDDPLLQDIKHRILSQKIQGLVNKMIKI